MLKKTTIAALFLSLVSAAALAGSDGYDNMKSMRDRMNAQLQTQSAPAQK
ncbi:hypothetical protein [Chromobacterium sp. IIBBL 290-4]|nr:hypothetical protein [Chromobacterium sp. IIBBL 290-4]UTH72469.1 hypothetical protein NKT35_12990 [Chromobacterium sp. IIBBL 290-4]